MNKKFYKKIFFNLLIIIFTTAVNADDKMNLGLEIYNEKAMCGTCHTLQSAGSSGAIGPNLDILKPQIPQIISAVKNGIGVMPPWDGILTTEEIEAVAYYVFNSTNN
jgi:mono/diheme cytochrome c family protein|tara:strand:- start:39 stop:359 length:321 start_codon:yes stop_codon:yes gene_type:complete